MSTDYQNSNQDQNNQNISNRQNVQNKNISNGSYQNFNSNTQQNSPSKPQKQVNRSQQIITIENFDETGQSEAAFINSPRSLQACDANGIKVKDLFIKTNDDIQRLFKGKANLTQEAIQQFQKTIELKRKQRVDVVKKARQQVIDQQQGQQRILSFASNEITIKKSDNVFLPTGFNNWRNQKGLLDSPSKTQYTHKSQNIDSISDQRGHKKSDSHQNIKQFFDNSSSQASYSGGLQHQLQKMKEKSERNLAKVRERQKKDIISILQTEFDNRKLQRRNEMKERKMYENLIEQKQLLEQKKQEYQENCEKKEIYRIQKENEQLEKMQTNLILKEHIEMDRQEKERQRKQQLVIEAKKREEQRNKNHQQALNQIQLQNLQVEEKIIIKMHKDQEKEQKIKEKQHVENEKRVESSHQKVIKQKERLEKNEIAHQQEMQKREEEYERKQAEQEQKKYELEEMRKDLIDLQRKQAEQKQLQIQYKNKEHEKEIQARNELIYQKMLIHEEIYKQMLMEKVEKVIMKGQKQRTKEQEIQKKKEAHDQEQYDKFHEEFVKMQIKQEISNQKKEEQLQSKVQRNQSAHFLRRYQVVDNKQRLDQVHDYNNVQLQLRLLSHDQRVQTHEEEKMQFRKEIYEIEKQNEREKQEIREKMEKRLHKGGELNVNELIEEFNLQLEDIPPELQTEFEQDHQYSQMSQSQNNFHFNKSKTNPSRQTTSHSQMRKSYLNQIQPATPQKQAQTSQNKTLLSQNYVKLPNQYQSTNNSSNQQKNQNQADQSNTNRNNTEQTEKEKKEQPHNIQNTQEGYQNTQAEFQTQKTHKQQETENKTNGTFLTEQN